ncbi:Mrp/NBP35 family ATP-binding protein [Pseudonocardia acidicola]|uniref:Iron-sulfur cluster carrier protein n=1 Tax=Pseudonocardia acidicola TaxID=2724939 RepID=A0ABX1S7Q8_9PSEU|nr:Mrp/NBP35 family ATP-binding protein [Pseudonocardia acidicola]NMH97598.1 Mrp/NBP35 family ATP-binding protein [Pseudonocardia acidicola]
MLGRRHPRSADLDGARAAAAAIIDPQLRRSLGELGMINDVRPGRRGGVTVELALATAEHPQRDELAAAVRAAVDAAAGPGGTTVDFVSMPARRRIELAEHLRATTRPITGSLGTTCRIYAVASGKGGVGKSTVTANVAAALAAGGKRVGVLDADVWGHSIPQLFGVHRNPLTLGGLMLPVPAHGVALMSVGFFVGPGEPVVWRGPMLHKALEQFLTDTYWGELDALLIDLPPGTGDITLSLLELVPDAALLAVTTPASTAHTVAERVLTMAARGGMPIAGVVENMTAAVCACCGERTTVFGEGGGRRLAAQAGVPLLAQIPLDVEARAAGDDGVPVVLRSPSSASGLALGRLAAGLPVVRRSLSGRALPLSVV